MILRKGKLSHTNICFIPTSLETAKGKSTSGLQTRCGPWVCLAYLRPQTESAFKISQTHAEVCDSGFSENKVWSQASQRTKSGPPWAHSAVRSACGGLPFCMGRVCAGLPASPGFFTQVTSFSSISIWVSNSRFIVYFDNLFKVLKTVYLIYNWFHILKESLKDGIGFFKLEFFSWLWRFHTEWVSQTHRIMRERVGRVHGRATPRENAECIFIGNLACNLSLRAVKQDRDENSGIQEASSWRSGGHHMRAVKKGL